MKILILSDSHASLRFMRLAMDIVRPNAVVHLGDHYDDARALAEEYPQTPFHMVPGNCDRFRMHTWQPEMLCYDVCGVRLYMTHGHLQGVKSGLSRLLAEGRKYEAAAVLYGHTHVADCRWEDDLWVVNPGSCGSAGGSVAVMETENGKITACRILRLAELEETL